MWDLSSPTMDQTRASCVGRHSLNHWTAREVLERKDLRGIGPEKNKKDLVLLGDVKDTIERKIQSLGVQQEK